MKFCKDCCHFQPSKVIDKEYEYAHCMKLSDQRDPVSGAFKLVHAEVTYCAIIRKSTTEGFCGPDAKFWECDKCANLEGEHCEEHADEAHAAALAEHGWMAGQRNLTSEELAQDCRDAGRGHLVHE